MEALLLVALLSVLAHEFTSLVTVTGALGMGKLMVLVTTLSGAADFRMGMGANVTTPVAASYLAPGGSVTVPGAGAGTRVSVRSTLKAD
jgi:hypothetical protein